MSGTKPNFLTGKLRKNYYVTPNPYENAPSCDINLLELSRYAKKVGKKMVELTQEEVQLFAIKNQNFR